MSCCEKQKYERLKDLSFASVLASQEAHLTGKKIAVVKLTHHHYGDYYKGINYDEAKREGYKVLRYYEPGKSMAVQDGDK